MKKMLAFPKVAGINIYIHWTFSLIILYIIYVNFKAGLTPLQIGWSVLFILCLFLCVTLHELGHAITAKHFGIKTKDITLYPIGGVARLEKMPEKASQEMIVAIAGPLVNILIMLLLLPLVIKYDFTLDDTGKALVISAANFLPMLALVNLWLALFNLIPAFPMDGGRVLRALLAMKIDRVKATRIAANVGTVIAIFFVLIGFYMNPFLIFIGLFIILGAQTELDMVQTNTLIAHMVASDAMMTNFVSLDKSSKIENAVKSLLDGEAKNFLITDNGNAYGTIDRNRIIKGLKNYGEHAAIEQITETKNVIVAPDTPLKEVYSQLISNTSSIALVMVDKHVIGIIDNENIAELILVKSVLQNEHAR